MLNDRNEAADRNINDPELYTVPTASREPGYKIPAPPTCLHCGALPGRCVAFCPTRDAEFGRAATLEDGESDVTALRDANGGCLCCGAPEVFACECVVIAVTSTNEPFVWCVEHKRDLAESGTTDRRDDLGGSLRLE